MLSSGSEVRSTGGEQQGEHVGGGTSSSEGSTSSSEGSTSRSEVLASSSEVLSTADQHQQVPVGGVDRRGEAIASSAAVLVTRT